MKNFTYIIIYLFIFIGTISCKQDAILEEKAKDFLSPDNSFLDKSGFESGLADIYRKIRQYFYANTDSYENFDMLGIDVDFAAESWSPEFVTYFNWNTMNADNGFADKWWSRLYALIYRTNVIIDRSNETYVTWKSDNEKNAIVGEAKFLRAWAYHFLGNMWGGVPLVLNETTSAKFDYTRSTQEEVYKQCKEDLEFAVQWMPTIDKQKGGRAPQAAAYHLLSEVDICLKDYDGAIAAASKVISDPDFYLMTQRFGTNKDFKFQGYDYQGPAKPWGDVYWDLFQEGNMNWLEGNHEAIWNMEMDFNILGGGNNKDGGYFVLERWWSPWPWHLVDKDGVTNLLKDTCCAAGTNVLIPTEYAMNQIWKYKNDWDNDIRNSEYNIQRVYYWVNPASKYYGQIITKDNLGVPEVYYRSISAAYKKASSAVHHGMFKFDGQNYDGGGIYKDWYMMRLPETYFLRAEAYFQKGDLASAAADINVVRNRAKATPVTAGDVNLDLILDERARELYMEEFRLSTLMRVEKLPEYVMKYNNVAIRDGWVLDDHLNKLPIPNAEIEANNKAVLEQNPGY